MTISLEHFSFNQTFRLLERLGGGGGCVGAERDVTQEGSREQTWQSLMVRGRWAKKGNFSAM